MKNDFDSSLSTNLLPYILPLSSALPSTILSPSLHPLLSLLIFPFYFVRFFFYLYVTIPFISFPSLIPSSSSFPLRLLMPHASCLSVTRVSPTWEVSQCALRAVPSERLCCLAQPRLPAADWQPSRPLPVAVSNAVHHFFRNGPIFSNGPRYLEI